MWCCRWRRIHPGCGLASDPLRVTRHRLSACSAPPSRSGRHAWHAYARACHWRASGGAGVVRCAIANGPDAQRGMKHSGQLTVTLVREHGGRHTARRAGWNVPSQPPCVQVRRRTCRHVQSGRVGRCAVIVAQDRRRPNVSVRTHSPLECARRRSPTHERTCHLAPRKPLECLRRQRVRACEQHPFSFCRPGGARVAGSRGIGAHLIVGANGLGGRGGRSTGDGRRGSSGGSTSTPLSSRATVHWSSDRPRASDR